MGGTLPEAASAKGQGSTELQIQVLTGGLGTSRSLSSAKPALKITLVYSPEAKVTKLNLMPMIYKVQRLYNKLISDKKVSVHYSF